MKEQLKQIVKERAILKENKAYYETKEMHELQKQGKTLREIGKIFKMTQTAVWYRLLKYEAGLFGHKNV